MKINANDNINYRIFSNENMLRKTGGKEKAGTSSIDSTLGTARMDTVSFGKNDMSDNEFIKKLSGDISAEVKAGKSDEYLNDIKQRIALGTYDINAGDIADKILG